MRLLEDLFKSLVVALVVAVLTPVVVAVGSRAATGDWTAWFRSVPWWVWTIACALMIAWVAALLVKRRKARLRQTSGPLIGIVSTPLYGWVEVGRIPYQRVIWVVRLPAPPPWGWSPEEAPGGAGDVDVSTPPRCPLCGTELEESRSFWWGYNWNCVSCGFSKRNRESFYTEVYRVERLARRDLEVHMQARRSQAR